ncbi:MAG: alanine racemase [Myxococcales bacterium]|nr:alanine racemase [Myxococcales bacterium]MDD9965952.1 alanine racemase [Myxococcales bacterium]
MCTDAPQDSIDGQGPRAGRRGSARPTHAEIDLSAIADNLRCLRRVASGARIFAVIKADAYGHGLVPVARRLEAEGVDGLCVALAEEGFVLRDAHVRAPILVLNGAYGSSHVEVLRAGLTPVIYDLAQAEAFARVASGARVNVHVKVDTGMARLGVSLAQLEEFLSRLEALTSLRIAGLMTHLSSADTDPSFTAGQLRLFEQAAEIVRVRGHRPTLLHAANSAGTYASPAAHYDVVRPGLSLYGVSPIVGKGVDLRPAMRVRTEVLAVRELAAGAPVGYNQAYHTTRPTRIACVPIGYGDGYLRAASNRGHMLVGGLRCPIIGRIAMDLTTLDVTHVPTVAAGDEVVVLGSQGTEDLSAEDLAAAADTIPYEVLCNISARVPRRYVS